MPDVQVTKCAGGRVYNLPMKTIYIDSLFLLSLFTDYLLCLISARFCGLYLRRKRYLLAALFGAAYSVSVFLPGMGFMALPVMELAAAAFMGLIAFGGEERLFRCIAVFLAVSATFGGVVWALSMKLGETPAIDLRLLFGCFAGCYIILSLISRTKLKRAENHIASVEMRLGENSAFFRALLDSGNCLADPVTGASVMLVSPRVLRPLFPDCAALFDIKDPVELVELWNTMPEIKIRLRLISYSSVGGSGLLPLFRPDSVTVDGKMRDGLLAAITDRAEGDGFEAVL